MLAQQGAQMLPFVLPVENSSAKKGRACAQCIGEAAGGARRVCGASNVKKNHDTLVECRKQKCVCAVQCVMRVSCGEQFTRHMLGEDAGRAVGSQSRAAQRVCQSRWCALSRRGRRWRACDFVGGRSLIIIGIPVNFSRASGPVETQRSLLNALTGLRVNCKFLESCFTVYMYRSNLPHGAPAVRI